MNPARMPEPSSRPRLLVTGGTGLLGGALVAAAHEDSSFDVHATRHRTPPDPAALAGATWHELDVRDRLRTRQLLEGLRPAVVVHAAIDVRPQTLRAVTVDGAVHVATGAHEAQAALVHLSSDMVFAGEPVVYDEDSVPDPVSEYGRAKADAETRVRVEHPGARIVRLPLLYRIDPPDRTLGQWLADARAGRAYPLFVDEIRCPAQVDDVARALLAVARALVAGTPAVPPVLHLAGPRALSRYDFGVGVLRALGLPETLAVPGRAADAPGPRPRELVFVARRTPAAFTAPLRSPEEAFRAAPRPTPPGGRGGG